MEPTAEMGEVAANAAVTEKTRTSQHEMADCNITIWTTMVL